MACKVTQDGSVLVYTVPEDASMFDAGGRRLTPSPLLQAWWSYTKNRRDETFIIRQENSDDKADVLEMTLVQLYDLHHAIGVAIMRA